MATTYNRTYTLRTYDETFEKARIVFKQHDLNVAQAFNKFLKQVALTGELPLLDEKEMLFLQLQKEVSKSIDDVEQGKGVTLAEARERFGI